MTIIAAQRLTARSFEHGHWEGGRLTDPTTAEVLWYWLPPTLIVAISALFFVCVQWWIPEKETRNLIRIWGCLLAFVAMVATFCISIWFNVLVFYMD